MGNSDQSQLRALRVPNELDKAITKEMKERGKSRTAVMTEWLEAGQAGNHSEVDWAEFDRQVQIALRVTPSAARALRAAREKLGVKK